MEGGAGAGRLDFFNYGHLRLQFRQFLSLYLRVAVLFGQAILCGKDRIGYQVAVIGSDIAPTGSGFTVLIEGDEDSFCSFVFGCYVKAFHYLLQSFRMLGEMVLQSGKSDFV